MKTKINCLLYLVIFGFTSLYSQSLPLVKKFEFKTSETKILPGNSTEVAKGCAGVIKPEDQIGDFAIAAIFFQNSCYTDSSYSNKNYKVELGSVQLSETQNFSAIKIYRPESKANKFLASTHVGYLKTNEDMNIYQLIDGSLTKAFKTIDDNSIPGGYKKIDGMVLSKIQEPLVYVIIPAKVNYNPFQKITADIEGAKVYQSDSLEIDKYRFSIKGDIFDTANSSTKNRNFFTTSYSGGIIIVWQDQKTSEVFANTIDTNFKSHKQIKLSAQGNYYLTAATADDLGNIYYILSEGSTDANKLNTKKVQIYKSDINGKNILNIPLDASEKGLNITNIGSGYVASLVFSNGKLGLILSRTMHKSPDGLNHQGAIAVVFDSKSLKILKNLGQTSGHSFGNILTKDSEGNFLGIDLGDNYPRGVHLHRFNESMRKGQVVYTFKTQHGTTAKSPAGAIYPPYTEISTAEKTFYKWSNDNRTYTGLGGVLEMDDGIAVFFDGEPDSNGKSINNSRAVDKQIDPRNIGMVYVKKDFNNSDFVLSSGIDEESGFYAFGGFFTKQINKGIVWLTNYKNVSKENASRVKTAKLSNDEIFAIWEIRAESNYISTQASIIKPKKGTMSKPENLGGLIRLGMSDDIIEKDGKVFIVSGNLLEQKLEIYQVLSK